VRMCVQCSRELADEFRFCPHCGTSQRSKIVEYFRGHPDVGDGGLRVSAYLTAPQHLRFSIWREERAEAAISLAPDEAHRLARFLLAASPNPESSQVGRSLRRRARALQRVVSRR
jgi:zinc-ribbon domain